MTAEPTTPWSLHDLVTRAQAAVLGDVAARRQVAALLARMSPDQLAGALMSVCAGVDLRPTATSRVAGFVSPPRLSDAQCWHALGLVEQGARELPVLMAALEHYRRQTEQERTGARRARLLDLDTAARAARATTVVAAS